MDIIFWSSLHSNRRIPQRYIGPYQLSHWLRKHDYTCQVIDFIITSERKLAADELYDTTKKFIDSGTLMIGVSTTFFKGFDLPDFVIECISRIKEDFPHVKFVLGGNRAEVYSTDSTKLFDGVVVGLSEDILLELVEFYKTGNNEPPGYKELPHRVKFYRKAMQTRFNIEDCDHKWADNDFILPNETLPIEISRGCIFRCKFCQYPLLGKTKNDYTRRMDLIKEELIDNYNRWGVTNYYFLDDTFNDTVGKVEAFYEMTRILPFKIRYSTYIRADLLHRFPETIPMLKESGLAGATFGIESFHPEMSKLVGKAWSGKHAKEFLPWLIHEAWNDEVVVHISLIAGLAREDGVTETREQLQETKKWLIDNNLRSWSFKGLGIVKEENNTAFASEFSKDIDKYGYYYPFGNAIWEWEHTSTDWTSINAKEVAKELNSSDRTPWDGWTAISFLTLGFGWPEAKFTATVAQSKKITVKLLVERSKNWYNTYFEKLKNYNPEIK